MTLGSLVQLYRSWLLGQVKSGYAEKGTFEYYDYYHCRFLAHCGDVAIGELQAVALVGWKTDWHAIQAVQRLFNWSEEMGINQHNPFRKVKKPPTRDRQRILQRDEELRLLRAANREFRAYCLMLRESIARPIEARQLEWSEFGQSPSGLPYFRPISFKGQRRRKDRHAVRIIPVTPRLGRLIGRIRRSRSTLAGPMLLNTEGIPWTGNAVRLEMAGLRKRLGLLRDRRGENVVCYSFRHTSATRAAQRGLRDRILAELLGHSSTRTTARYQHLDALDLLEVFVQTMGPRKASR